jgi:Ca2+-binding RTX toxin-like protein
VRNGFNDFFGNDRRSRFGGYARGPSTLNVDPRYIDVASSDYRLRKDSPLRDRGAPCTAGGLARQDAANHSRLVGTSVDIGAFEIGAGPVRGGSNVFGTGGADLLAGTPGADVLCGFGGSDTISGGGGNDHVYGGTGGDLVQGQDGRDYVKGDVGADTIRGGAGDDRLAGRDGKPGDTLSGGPGRDRCRADRGDRVRGCP